MPVDSVFRIGYFADGPWSHQAFELLQADQSIDIAFIVPRTDSKDQVLHSLSNKYGIDYLYPERINTSSFYEKAAAYDCDLFVSMSFNQIFRKKIIELPRLNTINCHAGKLPYYRGRNILNWVLINDETEFGITVHFVDEGIDTGDIILQRTYPITDQDDYASLLAIAHRECATLLYAAIKKIQDSTFSVTKQTEIHPVGFYCGSRGIGDEVIDWSSTSRQLFNFIRAITTPGPRAETTCRGEIVKIGKSALITEAPPYIGTPGQLIGKTPHGFLVKTKDTFMEIREIDTNMKLKVGDKLGT